MGDRSEVIRLPRGLRDATIPARTVRSADILLRSATVLRLHVPGYYRSLSSERYYIQLCEWRAFSILPTAVILMTVSSCAPTQC